MDNLDVKKADGASARDGDKVTLGQRHPILPVDNAGQWRSQRSLVISHGVRQPVDMSCRHGPAGDADKFGKGTVNVGSHRLLVRAKILAAAQALSAAAAGNRRADTDTRSDRKL